MEGWCQSYAADSREAVSLGLRFGGSDVLRFGSGCCAEDQATGMIGGRLGVLKKFLWISSEKGTVASTNTKDVILETTSSSYIGKEEKGSNGQQTIRRRGKEHVRTRTHEHSTCRRTERKLRR